jgi:hypothetical protein
MSENDERDPNNPLDRMMPPTDNPEYHRKLAEHRDAQHQAAETAVLADPAHAALGDRLTPVRQGAPQATAPQPLPQTEVPPVTPPAAPAVGTGITVDPTQAQVQHTPVEPRLPEGAGGGAPPPPPNTPPVAAPAAPVPPSGPPAGTNSILTGLREDFGIDSIPTVDIDINGHIFTMRVLDTASVSTALRFADTLSMTERENAINLQIALTAFAVFAIDGEPLWKVFSVPIPDVDTVIVEGERRPIFNPMKPPHGVRSIAASELMEFLSTELSASVLAELWKRYGTEVDPKGSLEELMAMVEGEPEDDVPLP